MLNLVFDSSGPHVEPRGAHRFVLYELDNGRYRLPDVELVTDPGSPTVAVQEARIAEVYGADRATDSPLRSDVLQAWNAALVPDLERIAERHVLAARREIDADRIDTHRAEPQERVKLQVLWRFRYTDEAGVQAARTETARLEFAPRGEAPPPMRQTPDPDAERLGVPAARRTIGTQPRYKYAAAVDFGTSASTVTVYDNRRKISWPIDPDQAHRMRARFADLLLAEPPADLGAGWSTLMKKLVEDVAKTQPQFADAAGIAERLRATPAAGTHDPLLDTVTAALEQRLGDAPAPLLDWLAPKLVRCYDEAFAVPPLRQLQLHPVQLDRDQKELEVATTVTIRQDEPVEITLGEKSHDAIRGIKARLAEPQPLDGRRRGSDGKDATTDDLIALVYKELIGRTEEFLRGEDKDNKLEVLQELVVTFPTTTPPMARLHLRRIVEYTLGITKPVVRYDEGVAAALYFLMRDFGGNRPEFGAEALRSRSRQISTAPPTWRQNMLVIDVGAGTTDIAVLRQNLIDNTKPLPDCPPEVQGRYYVLQPQVINSTGHPQLGGDYLTLRVLYWIKAAIVDAIVGGAGHESERQRYADQARQSLGRTDGELPPLAPKVIANPVEHPVPADVKPALSQVLPTHFDKNAPSDDRQPFSLLWALAEEAKIQLGGEDAGEAHVILPEQLRRVFVAIDVKGADAMLSLMPPEGLALPAADFRTLAEPVLDHIVALAQWLVEQALRDEPDERLDRVMLSGKTSLMPLMQQAVTAAFAVGGTASRTVANPSAIAVERDFAKQAASIGACWANVNRDLTADQDGEKDQLKMGRSVVNIDVDNIFQALPCEFVLIRSQQQQTQLLKAGTPLLEVDAQGTLAARVEWSADAPWPALVPGFEVHRPTRPGVTQSWGTYRFELEAKLEGFPLNEAIWLTNAQGDSGARVHAQLEIDENLVPRVHLAQGRPHYHVAPGNEKTLRSGLPAEAWSGDDRGLRALPAAVIVVGRPSDEYPDGRQELFPIWDPDPDEPVASYFPEYFHDHRGTDSEPISGRIAPVRVVPPANGDYRLLLRFPGGQERPLPAVQVPVRSGRTLRYTATLDVRGRLIVHRGYPPFWPASSLRDVEQHPGSVLRCEMHSDRPALEPSWDPFTGKH